MAEDKVIDKSEEEQLRVLEEKRAAHKELKSRMREKASKRLIRRTKAYVAARRKSKEAKKEAEKTEAEQQGEEAEKAESSEADLAATEWIGRDRKERCIKRIVRERHIKERLGKPAPPAARETSEAAVGKAERVCRPGKSAPPAAGETSVAVADESERLCCPGKPDLPAAGETSEAVADESERLCRQGKPAPPAAGETSEAVADKSERLSRPGKPAPPAAGETSAVVADRAERLCRMAGYKIPRRVSPIRKMLPPSPSRLCQYLWMAASSGHLKQLRRDSFSGSWWMQAWCYPAGRLKTTSGHTSDSRGKRTIKSSTAIEQ
jgi:hypothetical protein